MTFFQPFPIKLFAPLLIVATGFNSQYSHAQLGDSLPPSSYDSCNDIPADQEVNRAACNKHFNTNVHSRGIRIIPSSLTQITSDIIDATRDEDTQTLYIFESVDSQGMPIEYDLVNTDFGFDMPKDSTFAGNLERNERPRITLVDSGDAGYACYSTPVIRASVSDGNYWLADLEVDSDNDQSPQTVLDLKGARSASLNNVKVVRNPGNNVMAVKAIELGCHNDVSLEEHPSDYEIIDCEIDLTLTHQAGFENLGEAIFVTNCDEITRRANLKISNTLVVIDDRTIRSTTDSSELTPTPLSATPNSQISTGSVFFIHDGSNLNFLPGSTCNRVENHRGEDISNLRHLGSIQRSLEPQQVTGVFGLNNGYGWGWDTETPSLIHGNTYEGVLKSWREWFLDRCIDLSCSQPNSSFTTSFSTSLCQTVSYTAATASLTNIVQPTKTLSYTAATESFTNIVQPTKTLSYTAATESFTNTVQATKILSYTAATA